MPRDRSIGNKCQLKAQGKKKKSLLGPNLSRRFHSECSLTKVESSTVSIIVMQERVEIKVLEDISGSQFAEFGYVGELFPVSHNYFP